MIHFVNSGFLIVKDADGIYQQNFEVKNFCENYLPNAESNSK